jgi:hypothetical protein
VNINTGEVTNHQSHVAWERGDRGERGVNDQDMEEDELSEKLPFPPTKQYCPLLTSSWVISIASSLPVTFLTGKVSTRTSGEEASRQSICKTPRLGGFRNDELVRVGEEDIKKVEDVVNTDFIKASIDNDKESIVLIEIKSIVIVSDGTAKLTLKQDNEADATLVCGVDQPFFIFSAGWASLFPLMTKNKHGISCRILSMGDTIMVAQNKLRRQEMKSNAAFIHGKNNNVTEAQSDDQETYTEGHNEQPTDLSMKRHFMF